LSDKSTASKVFLAIVLLILVVLGSFAIWNSSQKNTNEDEIAIGFSGALTGPAAFIGENIKNGAELAIDEINQNGGILDSKIRLISRDDEHSPVKTVTQYRELIEQQKVVAMIGATNSASMLAVAPIVNSELKVPVICPATDATAITENEAQLSGNANYIFRVGMYGSGQANFMVDSAIEKFGYKRVALLTWTGGWGVTGREEILRRLREKGLEPVADETYDSSDTDMVPQLLKIKASKAQIILNYGLLVDNIRVMNSRTQLGDKTPYFSAWGIAGSAFPKAAGKNAEGTLVSTSFTTDGPLSSRAEAFVKAYRGKYGALPDAPVFAAGAYDSIYAIALAMEQAGNTDPEAIRNALENIDSFEGVVRNFQRPIFTSERHNSLTEADMMVTRLTEGRSLRVQFDDTGSFVVSQSGEKKSLSADDLTIIEK